MLEDTGHSTCRQCRNDLEPPKLYRVRSDEAAAADGCPRVIDESGEDYLYPQDNFLPIELPKAAEKALLSAA